MGAVTTPREVTGIVVHTTLAYVERALGADAVAAVLDRAGERRGCEQLMRNDEWSSFEQVIAIARAAAWVCGDSEIGRRVGEQLFRVHLEEGVSEFFRAEGSLQAAIEHGAALATKMSMALSFRVIESSDTCVVTEMVANGTGVAHESFFCSVAAGYWSQMPALFGAAGVVTQRECRGRGDDRCLIVLTCDHMVTEPDGDSWERSRERVGKAVARFEELHAMASEIALADDVSTVLDRIVDRADAMTMAPRFLLAVRLHDDEHPRVHHVGFAGSEADEVAAHLLSGTPVEGFGVPLVVDIVARTRCYGRMAAFFVPDSEVDDVERRHMLAFAGHVAAALESVENLDSARRNRDRFRALLQLAESLAKSSTSGEVADRLAGAIPGVTGCDRAAVVVWERHGTELRLNASSIEMGDPAQRHAMESADEAALRGLTASPGRVVVSVDEASAPLRRLMQDWQVARLFVVPVVVRDELIGLVAAGYTEAPPGHSEILARLGGVAHHAAIAFDNSALLDRVRHQALHDGLTGLPNRRSVEDHVQKALANRRVTGRGVALLFVDLDRFKQVNDTLGHSAGDELIRQVADRLSACVRETDVIARLGGDEFLVLLPDTRSSDDAVGVAEKINSALREPFTLQGRMVCISSSIGIARCSEQGSDYETLMKRADSAMYEAKAHGRNTYSLHPGDETAERRAVQDERRARSSAGERVGG